MIRAILTVWVIHAGVAVSPGMNTALIAQTAATRGRRSAFLVAGGVVAGVLVWSSAALFGLATVLEQSQTAFRVARVLGALYMVWLGLRRLFPRRSRTATDMPEVPQGGGNLRLFSTGLLTSLANPKSLVFFGSLFATAFPSTSPLWARLVALALVLANATATHFGLATLLSVERIRSVFDRMQVWMDRIFGMVFVGFGLRLLRSD